MPRFPGIDFGNQVAMEDIASRQKMARKARQQQQKQFYTKLITDAALSLAGLGLNESQFSRGLAQDATQVAGDQSFREKGLGQDESQFSRQLASRESQAGLERTHQTQLQDTSAKTRASLQSQEARDLLDRDAFGASVAPLMEEGSAWGNVPTDQRLQYLRALAGAWRSAGDDTPGDINPALLSAVQSRMSAGAEGAPGAPVADEPTPLQKQLHDYFGNDRPPPPAMAPLPDPGPPGFKPTSPPPLTPEQRLQRAYPYGGAPQTPLGPTGGPPTLEEKATQKRLDIGPSAGRPTSATRPMDTLPVPSTIPPRGAAIEAANNETSAMIPSEDLRRNVLTQLMGHREGPGQLIPGIAPPPVRAGQLTASELSEELRRRRKTQRRNELTKAIIGRTGIGTAVVASGALD